MLLPYKWKVYNGQILQKWRTLIGSKNDHIKLESPHNLFDHFTWLLPFINRGRRGSDRLVGGFTITYPTSAYHH